MLRCFGADGDPTKKKLVIRRDSLGCGRLIQASLEWNRYYKITKAWLLYFVLMLETYERKEYHFKKNYNDRRAALANLLELAKEIVAAHASQTPMSSQELIAEISEVYATLQAIEKGEVVTVEKTEAVQEEEPVVSKRKAFGKDKITCMICGKSMKTLARHLKTAHDLKPGEYRKRFGIPRTQPLAARAYSESRKQMAIDLGLGEGLAKARAARGKGKKKG